MNTLIDLIKSFKGGRNTALIYHNGYRRFTWSYDKLYRQILQCAAFLRGQDIGPGKKVLLWGPNGPDWVIAYFGIMAAGGVVVPVDLKAEPAHALRIKDSAGVDLIIKTKFKRSLNGESIHLEDLSGLIKDRVPIGRLPNPGPDELAELVYTSGTTGAPKGVMISHRNLISNVTAVVKRINVGPPDRLLSVLPLSHLFEQTGGMLAPLFAGASIVYLNTIKPSAIFQALKQEPITVFLCVPRLLAGFKKGVEQKFSSPAKQALWKSLNLAARRAGHAKRKKIFFLVHKKFNPRFRFFVSGGSYLDPDTERFWEGLGFKVIQGYGLSECSPILSVNSENDRRLSSAGQALDNVKLKLAPDGELLARGPNVFSGYYQDKEKTAAAFQEGWFLTGDVAKIDEEGHVYVKSRKKDVIVTAAGLNVYPEEIETVLGRQGGVKDCAVIGLDRGQGEEVAAVLIPAKKTKDLQPIIEGANRELAPEQQIRHFYVWPEAEFPKTTTLKVKKNLIRMKLSSENEAKELDKNDSILINILAEISGLPAGRINRAKTLYSDLKIDSIGRVELVSRLEQEFTLDLPEHLVTEKTTVGELEHLVEKRIASNKKTRLHNWAFSGRIKFLRALHWRFFGRPITGHWCKTEIIGRKNLKAVKGPALLIPNHLSYADGPCVLMALPDKWRRHTAIAAWREFFFPEKGGPLKRAAKFIFFYYAVVFWGAFPFSQVKNIKKTLEHSGRLMDQGNHIMLFPEGERSRNGKLLEFKAGCAVLVQNLKAPVIPVGIKDSDRVMHRDWKWPRQGKVTVAFGKPLYISDLGRGEILKILKKEIGKLI